LDKAAFSTEIRLPESRRNLSLTPMYATMAGLASRKLEKFLSPEFWNFDNFFRKTQYLGEQSLNARKIFEKFQVL